MKATPIVIQFKLYTRASRKAIKAAIDGIAETYGAKDVEVLPWGNLTSVTMRIPSVDLFKWAMLDDISEVCRAKVILHPKMAGPTPTWEEDYNKAGR